MRIVQLVPARAPIAAVLLLASACGGNEKRADTATAREPDSGAVTQAAAASQPGSPDTTIANATSLPALDLALVTPGAGSPTRTRILDAVRNRLQLQSRFKVDYVRMAGRWAFIRGTEVVELDKGELQETDLTVAALLELPLADATKFRVVEVWTLPDEQTRPFAEFVRRVREHVQRERLPRALLPDDL